MSIFHQLKRFSEFPKSCRRFILRAVLFELQIEIQKFYTNYKLGENLSIALFHKGRKTCIPSFMALFLDFIWLKLKRFLTSLCIQVIPVLYTIQFHVKYPYISLFYFKFVYNICNCSKYRLMYDFQQFWIHLIHV